MSALSTFLTSDTGFAAVFSTVATLGASLFAHVLRGKVRLIWFSPKSIHFKLKVADSPLHVNSGQIVIQNFGRQSAKCVQITSIPGDPPASYVILPSLVHSARVGPAGEWILEIPFIAPKEVVTIQVLNGPLIDSVRCEDGIGKFVPVIHQRLFPKPYQILIGILMLTGVIAIFFFAGWLISRSWL